MRDPCPTCEGTGRITVPTPQGSRTCRCAECGGSGLVTHYEPGHRDHH